MTSSTSASPTTRGPGRPRMARDRIVSAAVELARDEGAAALSFRTLADRLGSSTATLYRHFGERAELVSEVVDAILGEVDLAGADAHSDWDRRLIYLGEALFETLVRHRRTAPLLAEQIPTGPCAMAFREACLQTLVSAGFGPQVASTASATLGRFTLGLAIQLPGQAPTVTDDERITSLFSEADDHLYPAIHALAAHMPVSLSAEFGFGLRLMIAGLEQIDRSGSSA